MEAQVSQVFVLVQGVYGLSDMETCVMDGQTLHGPQEKVSPSASGLRSGWNVWEEAEELWTGSQRLDRRKEPAAWSADTAPEEHISSPLAFKHQLS